MWESEFPILDCCPRETIRVAIPGTLFRKNTSEPDIPIGDTGEVIPKGSFVAHLVDEIHLNPEVYPEPLRFDPRHTSTRTGWQTGTTFLYWLGVRSPSMS